MLSIYKLRTNFELFLFMRTILFNISIYAKPNSKMYAIGNRIEDNPIIYATSAQSPSIEVNASLLVFFLVCVCVCEFLLAQIKDDSSFFVCEWKFPIWSFLIWLSTWQYGFDGLVATTRQRSMQTPIDFHQMPCAAVQIKRGIVRCCFFVFLSAR